jgi:hypothetical protein
MANAMDTSHFWTERRHGPPRLHQQARSVMTPRPIACVDDGNVPAVTRPGETTMKMYLRALAVAAVLIVPTLAVADDTTLVQAFVPFEFTVGTTTLPAGTYRISRQFGAQDLLVVDGKGERVLLFASRLETPPARNAETHLTFHRYGDSYFLSAAQLSSVTGYTLPKASTERELAKLRNSAAPVTTVTLDLNGAVKSVQPLR